jgi:hypothetical protein
LELPKTLAGTVDVVVPDAEEAVGVVAGNASD